MGICHLWSLWMLRYVKIIYSEKATKFCEISTLHLSYVVPFKSKVEISQNFVDFSENMNFNKKYSNFNDILETMLQYSLQTPRNSCRNTDICAMVYHTYGLRIRFSLRLRHLSCLVTRKCNYDNYRLRKKNLSIWIR